MSYWEEDYRRFDNIRGSIKPLQLTKYYSRTNFKILTGSDDDQGCPKSTA